MHPIEQDVYPVLQRLRIEYKLLKINDLRGLCDLSLGFNRDKVGRKVDFLPIWRRLLARKWRKDCALES